MNCKNCELEINSDQNYCASCGAKVVTDRLTVRRIWNNLVDQFFGWDNKYLMTIKYMILAPETVLEPYLAGTRKKYVAPFAFLAIGTAITMLMFNQFSDEYMKMVDVIGQTEYDLMETQMESTEQVEAFETRKIDQMELNSKIQHALLKYYNIFTFLMVPFYAFIARLVFGKPFNYSEHLVAVTFIQGTIFIFSIILFLCSVLINPAIFSLSIFTSTFYYLYVYKRLYNLSLGKSVVKFLKFLGVLLLLGIVLGIIGVVVGIMNADLK